ncbi:hypothetical protein ACF07U_30225 [Streptomyces californicus]|uniref:hypothetical protein n=1 Tax=Streptomyces californicus TaxID=67351 RepID=UPI0036F5B08C
MGAGHCGRHQHGDDRQHDHTGDREPHTSPADKLHVFLRRSIHPDRWITCAPSQQNGPLPKASSACSGGDFTRRGPHSNTGIASPRAPHPDPPPEHFSSPCPDCAVLSAWNHAEEIMAKEQEFKAAGGRWILYVPDVHLA